MKRSAFIPSLLFFLLILNVMGKTQDCQQFDFKEQSNIPSFCGEIMMTMIHDQLNRPYLYIANKEAGLTIYDIEEPREPKFVADVPIQLFDSLHVMNLSQEGDFLYLALGNHFTNPQQGGMAIIDMHIPDQPSLLDFFIVPESNSGAGIVKVNGDYAYLGAMKSGLVILDVQDKSDIQLVSQFIPDINFPVADPNPDLYNARGMVVLNDIVYLCYDAGGLRIINCENKSKPRETGRFANPALFSPINLPRAYNNLVLDDSLIYIAVDYCGLEVLNVSDTSNIEMMGWWNPFDCPRNNWFSSPVHANELYFDQSCTKLFVSTGKSDLMVLDMTDPSQPEWCQTFGGVSNNVGTWGVSGYKNEIYLSYICAIIPFTSSQSSVKILTYSSCQTTNSNEKPLDFFKLYPNPANHEITLEGNGGFNQTQFRLYNSLGKEIRLSMELSDTKVIVDTSQLPVGLYYLFVRSGKVEKSWKFVVKR